MKKLERVLYAEDEPNIQKVAKMALEMVGGFQALICDDGAQALAQVQAFAPDLILLDVMMPNLDGPQTLQALRRDPATASIPVFFLTAQTRPEEIQALQAQGVQGVLAKPFNPMTLATQVQALWDTL